MNKNDFERLTILVDNQAPTETIIVNPESKEQVHLISKILKKRTQGKLSLLFQSVQHQSYFFEQLLNQFLYIEAAGGRVFNTLNQVLLIYRRGKWDLPKGKIENQEKPDQAAIREVAEETGLTHHTILKPLPPTFHIYLTSDLEWYLKKTFWFDMQTSMPEMIRPQKEEQISKVIFTELSFARNADSWLSIHEVLNQPLP